MSSASRPERLLAEAHLNEEASNGAWIVVVVDQVTGMVTAQGPYPDADAAAKAASRLQADLDSLGDEQPPMQAIPVVLKAPSS